MAESNPRRTSVSVMVAAPAAEVFRACIDPGLLVRWRVPDDMTAEVEEMEARPGGRLRMALTYVDPGRAGKSGGATDRFESLFVALEANREIVEAIDFRSDDPAFSGTMTVRTHLDAAGRDATRVTLTCENLPSGIALSDNEEGTRQSLTKLAGLFA